MNPAAHRRHQFFARPLAFASCLIAISGLGPRAVRAELANEPPPLAAQALDLVLLRPLGTVRVAAGAVIWIPISIVQALMDLSSATFAPLGSSSGADGVGIEESLDVFVIEPAHYVFQRPLGQDLDGG